MQRSDSRPSGLVPHSSASVGHPTKAPNVALWSDQRLRGALRPSAVQRALARRQPQAILGVSLGVWLPTVVMAFYVFPGTREGLAWVTGAVVLYPMALLVTALASRLWAHTVASAPPALELARRTGTAPLEVYEEEARAALEEPGGPATVVLLRQSDGLETLLRLDILDSGEGHYTRVVSRVALDAPVAVQSLKQQGALLPSERAAVADLLDRVAHTGVGRHAESRAQDAFARRMALSVLRRGRSAVERFTAVAPPYARSVEDHPAVQAGALLARMADNRIPFADERWVDLPPAPRG